MSMRGEGKYTERASLAAPHPPFLHQGEREDAIRQTCSSSLSFRRCDCNSRRSTYSRSSSISSLTCCTVSSSFLMATMSRFTSVTSDWHDSSDRVSSCNCDRISESATLVSAWPRCSVPQYATAGLGDTPRDCSSSSRVVRLALMSVTWCCKLRKPSTMYELYTHNTQDVCQSLSESGSVGYLRGDGEERDNVRAQPTWRTLNQRLHSTSVNR